MLKYKQCQRTLNKDKHFLNFKLKYYIERTLTYKKWENIKINF